MSPMGKTTRHLPEAAFAMRFAKRIDSLEPARLAVLDYLGDGAVGPAVINRIEVVLEELMANIVRHAQAATAITVMARIEDGGVVLSVEDDGAAFNPLDVPEPDAYTTLEGAVEGGQGIPLIRRLSKQVRYKRTAAGNRVTVVFAHD